MSANEYFGELAPAAHSRKKSEMWTALAELDTNDEFFPHLIMRISEGEFLSTLASEIKVNHSILRNWIRGNKEREKIFGDAERDGRQSRINKVLQKTYEAATADIAEPTTRMEQLRAAEVMLRQQQPDQNHRTIANINISFVAADNGKPKENVIDHVP